MNAAAAIAEDLDRLIGTPEGLLQHSIEPDDRDDLPNVLCATLEAQDLGTYSVPVALNGRLRSFEELAAILAVIAQRDPTAACVQATTCLASLPVWIGASDALQREVAALVLRGGRLAFAVTEREHGADLLATGTHAVRARDGYLLTGEKWLINNATRADAAVVLARTTADAGPRSLTLFFVEKERLARDLWQPLTRVRTHGIRGADISGIGFHRCWVPSACVVGGPGLGLELTLRALQVSRALVPAISIGIGAAILQRAAQLASTGNGGNPMDAYAATVIARSYADLWMAARVVAAATRGIHIVPQEMSLVSAVTKAVGPALVDRAIAELSTLTGRRRAIRFDADDARMHKGMRDAAVVALFDGSTVVNLHAISLQLAGRRSEADAEVAAASAGSMADSAQPLPPFAPSSLTLTSRGRDSIVDALPPAVRALESSPRHRGTDLASAAMRIAWTLERLRHPQSDADARHRVEATVESLEIARRYSRVHAAAAVLHAWHASPDRDAPAPLAIATCALLRTADDLDGVAHAAPPDAVHVLCDDVVRRCREGRPLLSDPSSDIDHGRFD